MHPLLLIVSHSKILSLRKVLIVTTKFLGNQSLAVFPTIFIRIRTSGWRTNSLNSYPA